MIYEIKLSAFLLSGERLILLSKTILLPFKGILKEVKDHRNPTTS